MNEQNEPKKSDVAKPAVDSIVRLEKLPNVELVITSTTGEVMGVFSFGLNEALAGWLRRSDQMDDKDKPVNRTKEALLVLGQDMFVVSREYVLMLRSLAYPNRSHHEINELGKVMPETAIYTFVVAY